MSKSALIALAESSEELEAITLSNVLRRANIRATLASVESTNTVTCARHATIVCDARVSDLSSGQTKFDFIVLPGGMPGASRVAASAELKSMMKKHVEQGRWYGAICASPAVVLKEWGLFPKKGTCYPAKGFLDKIEGAENITEKVVVDEEAKCVTSQGPGTAMAFALKIIELLEGKEVARSVAKALIFEYS